MNLQRNFTIRANQIAAGCEQSECLCLYLSRSDWLHYHRRLCLGLSGWPGLGWQTGPAAATQHTVDWTGSSRQGTGGCGHTIDNTMTSHHEHVGIMHLRWPSVVTGGGWQGGRLSGQGLTVGGWSTWVESCCCCAHGVGGWGLSLIITREYWQLLHLLCNLTHDKGLVHFDFFDICIWTREKILRSSSIDLFLSYFFRSSLFRKAFEYHFIFTKFSFNLF